MKKIKDNFSIILLFIILIVVFVSGNYYDNLREKKATDKFKEHMLIKEKNKEQERINNSIYLKQSNDKIDIMFKYCDTNDMIIKFDKVGINNLMQLNDFHIIENSEQYCSGDFNKNKTIFKKSYSDWVGPYMCYAKNNVDWIPDTSKNNFSFTGGWHGSNGNQTGGTTAQTISYKLFVDDVEIEKSNKTVPGNEVKLVVINQVNGSNTVKSDGTGRNILQEEITYTITPNKIEVRNVITALEDLVISKYYGIQTDNGSRWDEKISLYNQNQNLIGEYDFSKGNYYNDDIKYIVCSGNDDYLTAYLNNDGLGNFQYSNSHRALSMTYKKTYFSLIDGNLNLNKGNQVSFSGGYILSKQEPRFN